MMMLRLIKPAVGTGFVSLLCSCEIGLKGVFTRVLIKKTAEKKVLQFSTEAILGKFPIKVYLIEFFLYFIVAPQGRV